MALANILETIRQEALEQVEEIEKDKQTKIEVLKKEYSQKEAELKDKILAEAKLINEKRIEQARFQAENQAKSEILDKKQTILDETFDLAVKELTHSPDNDQIAWLCSLLKELPEDKQGELKSTKHSLSLVKKANEKCGNKFKISTETVEGNGGFIFLSPKVEINNCYSALVEEVRGDLETEIAKILFS